MTAQIPAMEADASKAPLELVSQRRILSFWLPLAASWLLMSTEMPFVNAMLARLSEAERMIAAFGIVASLSITIESPVIMLLATTTALALALAGRVPGVAVGAYALSVGVVIEAPRPFCCGRRRGGGD